MAFQEINVIRLAADSIYLSPTSLQYCDCNGLLQYGEDSICEITRDKKITGRDQISKLASLQLTLV